MLSASLDDARLADDESLRRAIDRRFPLPFRFVSLRRCRARRRLFLPLLLSRRLSAPMRVGSKSRTTGPESPTSTNLRYQNAHIPRIISLPLWGSCNLFVANFNHPFISAYNLIPLRWLEFSVRHKYIPWIYISLDIH